jgi:hypothetical protein
MPVHLWRVGLLEPGSGEGAVFLFPSLLQRAFFLANLTGLNWGRLEIQKRHRVDRQTDTGVRVETPNSHCFCSLSLFFKALLFAVL